VTVAGTRPHTFAGGVAARPTWRHVSHWDRLRIAAMLDIVAFHVTGEHGLFGIGLPLFLLLSIALAVQRPEPPPTRSFVQRRIQRLLVPWLFWCALLALLRAEVARHHGGRGDEWWTPWMLLYGPEVHLWFLPFIAVAGLVAHLAQRASLGLPARATQGAALLLAASALALDGLGTLPDPIHQWCFAAASIPLGLAVGGAVRAGSVRGEIRGEVTRVAVGFVVLALLVAALDPPAAEAARRYSLALGALAAVLWLPDAPDAVTTAVTPLLLGVYILHPPIDEQLALRLNRLLHDALHAWTLTTLVFLLTLALTAGLWRTRLRRFL
jgi:hypothetical protein